MRRVRTRSVMVLIAGIAPILVASWVVWGLFQPISADDLIRCAQQEKVIIPAIRLEDYRVRTIWVPSPGFKGGRWEMHCEHKITGERRCFEFVEHLLMGGFFDLRCLPDSTAHPIP